MKRFFILVFLSAQAFVHSQEIEGSMRPVSNYLEDQFYLGVTYNLFTNLPKDISHRNLSYGLQGGFIKDIPLNEARTIAMGAGLGFGINSYYTNLLASKTEENITYSRIESKTDYSRNKIETHILEFPIEFRWRNSSPEEYKFWRVYSGVKMGYVLNARSKYVSDLKNISFSNGEIKKFQYGLTFSVGYNTFNFHAYYALSSLFNKDVTLASGEQLKVKPLRVGLIFYIL
ncbi:Outer membrane protein beta-barrel domain-containing protein [Arenibacter nanhaiticus]|uniref:Outer membrane protein beta-barrel domain-containing protein n=1 Tax=Arenibacter nanhaiticus TaxID=558155 RepID=A0A1M6GJA5_9FLAO|nr:porin family protein [Arenibacter nanhaiticus]SHJ10009.1 Outer membrane protein beta-barrel domain-containing protein [Arenibacter nanhaiticus]